MHEVENRPIVNGKPSDPTYVTTVALEGGGFRITGATSGWSVGGSLLSMICASQTIIWTADGAADGTAQPYPVWASWVATDPEGVVHPLNLLTNSPNGGTTPGNCGIITQSPSFDGSGLMVDVSSTPFKINLPDGTLIHPMAVTQYNSNGVPISASASTEDPNGNISSVNVTYTGSNYMNNVLSTVYNDNVGRAINVTNGALTTYTSAGGNTTLGYANTVVSYTDSSGTLQSYTITYQAIDIAPNLCSGSGPIIYCIEGSTVVVPTTLTMPDGSTSYTFSWYENSMGELQSVTLPTGGTFSYQYATLCLTPPNGSESTTGEDCRRAVVSRTESVNGQSNVWTYNVGTFTNGVAGYSSSVTDPYGNEEVHYFTPVQPLSTGPISDSTVETTVKSYSGSSASGTLLQEVDTQFTSELDPILLKPENIRPISVTTTLDNGLVKQTQTDYETFPYVFSSYNTSTLTRLNPTEIREYAFGTGSPGALARKTDYTYLHNANTAYVAKNIVKRPVQITVYDGASIQRSQAINEYDNYTAGIQTSSATSHDASYNTSYTLRGNLTAKSQWVNTTGGLLTTRNQYDDSGNVVSVTDPKLNTTTFSYADVWYDFPAACAPSSGQARAYLSSSTNAIGQTTTYSNYSCSGLRATAMDPNKNTAYMAFDWAGRQTCQTNTDGGQTITTYSDATNTATHSALISSTAPATNCKSVAAGTQKVTAEVYDGLGRKTQDQTVSDLNGADIITTCYDSLDRVSQKTNPYRGTALACPINPGGVPYTAYYYDPLGRPIETVEQDGSILQWCYDGVTPSLAVANCSKQIGSTTTGTWVDSTDENGNHWQRSSDACGRLTKVMEPSGASQSPSMETDYGYDALNNLLSVTQYGGAFGSAGYRSRTFNYDSLSRLLCASNPENSSAACSATNSGYVAGTIGYSYDANSNLQSKTDARGVVTGYSYDSLNRLLSKTYTGNVPAGTLSNCYQFDTSTNNGIGRLGAEWTQGGTCSSTVPTSFYSSAAPSGYQSLRVYGAYDAMGRALTEQQCVAGYCTSSSLPSQPAANCATLSSATGLQYCYDLAGNLLAYSNGLTTQAASQYPQQALLFAQTFDSVGRLNSVGSSWTDSTHPQSLFSSPAYTPFNALSSWLLGTQLTTSRTYDTRLRVTGQSSAQ
jgi:YD repeat-containing protein